MTAMHRQIALALLAREVEIQQAATDARLARARGSDRVRLRSRMLLLDEASLRIEQARRAECRRELDAGRRFHEEALSFIASALEFQL
jgi:hypothetical protein